MVLALDAFAVAREYLEYDEVEAKSGEATSSEPKFDNPATDGKETKPEKAKFELGTLPEGVTKDQVSVDSATGVVTFTPNADQAGKTFKFPVMMRNEDLQVPVLDENGDPVKGEDDQPKTQGRVVAHADAPFKVEERDATLFEPAYEGKLVVPGQETKSAPSFTGKDGKGVDVPEGSKFSIGDYKAPEGYVVSIDENTGEITVTFPDGSKLNKDTVEEFDVPVTVTCKDGSTDEVKANFKLDTDGDGDPDVTDPDDDGDGIPDKDDSNPKVPNQNTLFEPAYENGSGKPGDKVTIPAPSFKDKDGNPTTAPDGTKFTPGEGTPDGVTVNEDGSIKVTIPEDAKPGDKITVPVVVTYPDDSTDTVEVTVTVEKPDTKTPDWKDGSGEPGGKVVIPNDGGPVEDGTTVDTDGPGKAKIDGDGNLVVDIDDNAKPGDKIVVIVKDKNGNEIDRVTVTVEKPAAGDMTTEPGVKKFKLVRTGAQVAGLVGIAAVMGVAGLGLALVRRRREGEEN